MSPRAAVVCGAIRRFLAAVFAVGLFYNTVWADYKEAFVLFELGPSTIQTAGYAVDAGVYSDLSAAEKRVEALTGKGVRAALVELSGAHVVRLGVYRDVLHALDEARAYQLREGERAFVGPADGPAQARIGAAVFAAQAAVFDKAAKARSAARPLKAAGFDPKLAPVMDASGGRWWILCAEVSESLAKVRRGLTRCGEVMGASCQPAVIDAEHFFARSERP